MEAQAARARRIHLFPAVLAQILLLAAIATSASAAAPRATTFVHSVGFSFDYPAKWKLERVREGMMLIPHTAGTDGGGRPLELVVIGFVDAAGVTDPFDPSFADAFENGYRAIVPDLARVGDLDWVESPMGTGLVVPFQDRRGNHHRLYCNVRGNLGIFLAHVAQDRSVRPQHARVRQIFSSFGWSDSVIDPELVRSWRVARDAEAEETLAGHWSFADHGRFRYIAEDSERRGFYSSFGGVLSVVWDHGVEESYLYKVSSVDGVAAELELQRPGGEALHFH
ncbi:MAG: hypothetical protein GY719_09665 [bacterium]|nr:hypothetical protein [bacterium]